MLQVSPQNSIDAAPLDADDDLLYCAHCRSAVTRLRWRMVKDGRHQHLFVNPAGLAFEIGLYALAPGAGPVGQPTLEATWFSGSAWQVAICRACQDHLGWRYSGGEPAEFWGLIGRALTASA